MQEKNFKFLFLFLIVCVHRNGYVLVEVRSP